MNRRRSPLAWAIVAASVVLASCADVDDEVSSETTESSIVSAAVTVPPTIVLPATTTPPPAATSPVEAAPPTDGPSATELTSSPPTLELTLERESRDRFENGNFFPAAEQRLTGLTAVDLAFEVSMDWQRFWSRDEDPDGDITLFFVPIPASKSSGFSSPPSVDVPLIDQQVVLTLAAQREGGNQLLFECPNVSTGGCLAFAGPSFFSFTAEFTTEFPSPGDPIIFRNVDLTLDDDGVLNLVLPTIIEQRDDSNFEPGLYPITSIGAFIRFDDTSSAEWFWDPQQLAGSLPD